MKGREGYVVWDAAESRNLVVPVGEKWARPRNVVNVSAANGGAVTPSIAAYCLVQG